MVVKEVEVVDVVVIDGLVVDGKVLDVVEDDDEVEDDVVEVVVDGKVVEVIVGEVRGEYRITRDGFSLLLDKAPDAKGSVYEIVRLYQVFTPGVE